MTGRLQKIIKYYGINSSKLAEEIGVQKSSISHVLSGRNKPSLDFIQKLLSVYPDINADWLILGKGKMIIDENENDLFSSVTQKATVENKIPTKKTENTGNVLKTVSTNDLEPKTTNNTFTPEQSLGKKATRIVTFYSDNTFKEYFPEN